MRGVTAAKFLLDQYGDRYFYFLIESNDRSHLNNVNRYEYWWGGEPV